MRKLLGRFGFWLARRYGAWPTDALIEQARALSRQWMNRPDLSGEYKRHQVYARMIKDHPGVSRRAIAMAIEMGLE